MFSYFIMLERFKTFFPNTLRISNKSNKSNKSSKVAISISSHGTSNDNITKEKTAESVSDIDIIPDYKFKNIMKTDMEINMYTFNIIRNKICDYKKLSKIELTFINNLSKELITELLLLAINCSQSLRNLVTDELDINDMSDISDDS